MNMNRQEVGKLGEKLALKFLKKKGYHIREPELYGKSISIY